MAAKFKVSRAAYAILRQLIDEDSAEPSNEIHVKGHVFKRICQRCSVYRCKSLNLVVKQPNFIMTPNTPLKVRVPTVKITVDGWVAQPIVRRTDTTRAMAIIQKKLGNFYCDLHTSNVGWWRNQAVMFDW